jgi:hypothetical protein
MGIPSPVLPVCSGFPWDSISTLTELVREVHRSGKRARAKLQSIMKEEDQPLSLLPPTPMGTPCVQCGAPLNPHETASICTFGCGTLHMQCVNAHSSKHSQQDSPKRGPSSLPALPAVAVETKCAQCGGSIKPDETVHICSYICGTLHVLCVDAHSTKHSPRDSPEAAPSSLPTLPAIGTHCAHCFSPINRDETVEVCTYCCGTLHVLCVKAHYGKHDSSTLSRVARGGVGPVA